MFHIKSILFECPKFLNIILALQVDQISLHKVALDQDFPDHIVPQIQIQFQPLCQGNLLRGIVN